MKLVEDAAQFKILLWKSEGRRPLEITRRREENDLKCTGILRHLDWRM
jgi:hypothetical protein